MKITSKDLFAQVKKQHETTLAAAFKSGNPEQMAEAMTAFFDGMNEAVLQKAAEEIDARNQDAAILSARGANVLTADERAYYEGLAAALKASDPRAAVANYEVAMPQTVIERIIGTIKKTHPLLDKLNFVSTAYLSRILVNAKPAQLATWGKITGAVQKEIEGGVQEIALTMCKLSAFLCISMDLVELGPEWMDAYARETLSEAIACACEAGAVAGTGKDEPIGMIRDMAADVSPTTGYAKQAPVKVKKLDPATMGALLKKLARDPNDSTGKTARVVDPRDVIVVFNPFDYWEKVFAATTLLVGGLARLVPLGGAKTLLEGVLKIAILVGYMAAVSRVKEIHRMFCYHGAEHKTIACYEAGLPLEVENVRKCCRFHPRCGTSFLLIVIVVSILLNSVIPWGSLSLRIVFKLLLLPVVVAVSYEIIKLCGKYDNAVCRAVSAPGLWLQRITTQEPDDSMIECAIAAVTPVLPERPDESVW